MQTSNLEHKSENISKKSFYQQLIVAKNFTQKQLSRPYMIVIIVALFFGLFTLMFFLNVFYNKKTDLEIVDGIGIPITTYFRTLQEAWGDEKAILYNVYPAITKIFVGVSVPVVGYAIQITTQNRLSSPSTLGFTPAGIIAYITVLALAPEMPWLIYVFGFLFTGLIILINFILQRQKDNNRSFKPVLIGFAISAAITSIGIIISVVKPNIVDASVIWTGNVSNTPSWIKLYIAIPFIVTSTIILFALTPKLKIMQKDFLLAKSLGINTNAVYWVVSIVAGIITISTISISSPIILLGLIIPNIVRATFNKHNPLFVFSVSIIFTLALLEVSLFLTIQYRFGSNFLMAIISAFVLIFIMRKRG